MWHNSEMRQHGGQFCTRMVSRSAGFLACLVITAAPALAQTPNPLLPRNLSPWGMFLSADVVVKAVMIGLAFASMVTWTVWLAKTVELAGARRRARRRIKVLESGGDLMDAARACDSDRDAVAQLILSAAREADLSGGIADEGFKERVALRLERVETAMTRRISRGTGLLATIGATAPFVGLFGTVWGIYHALTAIGIAGQASIDKVAGPVGEALIMTALGLAVAVPAVFGYNWLVRRNRVAMEQVRRFGSAVQMTLLGGGHTPHKAL